MQNDLISRSALIEQLKNCTCTDKRDEYMLKDFATLIVENQPTAYDVDAVVEQLEELADLEEKRWNAGTSTMAIAEHRGLMTAIGVVRKGGVK